jgi:hypothetical protein
MVLLLILLLAPDLASLSREAEQIDRLIEQLGSERYAERQAATTTLKHVGEPALDALRRASRNSNDAEIRRRAKRLVENIEVQVFQQRVQAIRRSQLSPEKKGQELKKLLRLGVTQKETYDLLGRPSVMFCSKHSWTSYYDQYRLVVSYDQYGRVSSIDPAEPVSSPD